MRKLLYFLALLSFISCSTSVMKDADVVSFVHDSMTFQLEFKSEETVHVICFPEDTPYADKSLTVKPGTVPCKVRESGENIRIMTSSLEVVFDKETASLSFHGNDGKQLLIDSGRSFRPRVAGGEKCFEIFQKFSTDGNDALYGLGQYQDGILDYRNCSVRMSQSNMDIVNPMLVSSSGYGILWDNYSATDFSDDGKNFTFVSEAGCASDYYFISGGNMDGVISAYRDLTGEVPMFGKWVFGFWQSKERYKSFDELLAVVREYRRRGVPLDNIVQDWEYWGDKDMWNSLTFDQRNFGSAAEVIDSLHSFYNVHFMLSVWPGFGPETEIYSDLDSIGALFDEPTWAGYKVFDAYNPEARDIFWKYLKEGLYDKGVDAWWMDATEPSFRDGFTREGQEARSKSAGKTYIGSFDRYLNVYSLELMKDLYGRLRRESDEKRVFLFTRSAFASQQHYGTAVWSGDVGASWKNMHRQLLAGLNLSASGFPYWTSDTGGFFVSGRDGEYPDGLGDSDYLELYSRWFQFGAFTPVFRAHGTDVPREIWQFGEPGDIHYDNQLKYIRLRYRLIPYIYSLSHMVHSKGYTFMRLLAMDFGNDKMVFGIDNSYMFGPSLLVRPVFSSCTEEFVVKTYLPECDGGVWYGFWDGTVHKAGTVNEMPNTLDVLPLFVKAGSVVPLAKVKQWVAEYPDTHIELRIYAGADAEFELYDDEGDSYRYERGEYSVTPIAWDDASRELKIGTRIGKYEGMPESVEIDVKIYLPSGEVVEKNTVYKGKAILMKI